MEQRKSYVSLPSIVPAVTPPKISGCHWDSENKNILFKLDNGIHPKGQTLAGRMPDVRNWKSDVQKVNAAGKSMERRSKMPVDRGA